MTSPWLLVLSGGVTAGAIAGVPGLLGWVAAVAIVALPGRSSWVALVLVAMVGGIIGAARVALDAAPPLAPVVIDSVAAEVVVRSVPQVGPSGPRAVVRVEQVSVDDAVWAPAEGDVLVLFRAAAPDHIAQGDRLSLHWGVSVGDPTGFGRFARSSGASGWATAYSSEVMSRGNSVTTPVTRLRDLITRRITEAIPGDGGALMAGFVTGDDSALSNRARSAFEQTGMSHITAVSGSNVAVLLAMWLFVMPTGRLRRSILALTGVTLLIGFYVLLVGMGAGAVRAGLMAMFMLPAARMGRRPDPLTALLLASASMLLVQPDFAYNVGFWLSLAASGAIVLCVDRHAASRIAVARSGAIALLAAQAATLPLIVLTFGGWSPASLLANLILGPIVSAVFPLAFTLAIVATLAPWIGDLVGWLPGIVADVIIAIVERIAREATMVRLGAASSRSILLLGVLSAAVVWVLSGESRRWLARVAWRWPAIDRYATAAAVGVGLGAWLAVLAWAI